MLTKEQKDKVFNHLLEGNSKEDLVATVMDRMTTEELDDVLAHIQAVEKEQ